MNCAGTCLKCLGGPIPVAKVTEKAVYGAGGVTAVAACGFGGVAATSYSFTASVVGGIAAGAFGLIAGLFCCTGLVLRGVIPEKEIGMQLDEMSNGQRGVIDAGKSWKEATEMRQAVVATLTKDNQLAIASNEKLTRMLIQAENGHREIAKKLQELTVQMADYDEKKSGPISIAFKDLLDAIQESIQIVINDEKELKNEVNNLQVVVQKLLPIEKELEDDARVLSETEKKLEMTQEQNKQIAEEMASTNQQFEGTLKKLEEFLTKIEAVKDLLPILEKLSILESVLTKEEIGTVQKVKQIYQAAFST